MREQTRKPAIKFCNRNIEFTDSSKVIEFLQRDYKDTFEVYVVDCFKRCLECRKKPFCRIQLSTIAADDSVALLEKIIRSN